MHQLCCSTLFIANSWVLVVPNAGILPSLVQHDLVHTCGIIVKYWLSVVLVQHPPTQSQHPGEWHHLPNFPPILPTKCNTGWLISAKFAEKILICVNHFIEQHELEEESAEDGKMRYTKGDLQHDATPLVPKDKKPIMIWWTDHIFPHEREQQTHEIYCQKVNSWDIFLKLRVIILHYITRILTYIR